MSKACGGWLNAGMDFWMLGAEASTVIARRLVRIATGGPAGAVEAERMVTEKVCAGFELPARVLTGGLGFTPLSVTQGALTYYRRKVAANNRRLSHAGKPGRTR